MRPGVDDSRLRKRRDFLLSEKPAEACHQHAKEHQQKHGHHPQRPLVICCQDDLCNYGSQHVQIRLYAAHPHGAGGRNDSATGERSFVLISPVRPRGNKHASPSVVSDGIPSAIDRSETLSPARIASGHGCGCSAQECGFHERKRAQLPATGPFS